MSTIKCFITLILVVLMSNILFAQSPKIFITPVKNMDNNVSFSYTKEGIGSYIIDFNFTKLDNSEKKTIPKMNVTASSGLLFKLKPIDKNKKIDFSYSYSATQGFLNPVLDPTLTYVLPFKKGKKVKIYLATRPDISPEKWKKFIVNSNIPDSIYSMRNGLVVAIKTIVRYNKDQANINVFLKEIVVEHPDGTFASYLGIAENSIAVKIGQTINSKFYLGVMDKIKDIGYSITFDIFYHELDEKNYRGNLVTANPIFITQNGVEKIESNKEYVVCYN